MLFLFSQAAVVSVTPPPTSITVQVMSGATVVYSVVVSGQSLTYKVVTT